MRREKFSLVILGLLFFSLLAAASGGLWLLLQPAPISVDSTGSLLGLSRDHVLTGLFILSLANLVFLAGYLVLQWPVISAGAAALLPQPTARGLATAVAALGALVLLSLPWLGKAPRPALVQPLPEQATPVAAAPAAVPIPGPTMAPPARPAPKMAAVRPRLAQAAAVRQVVVRHRNGSVHRPYWWQPARFKPAFRPCKGYYATRRLWARY